MIAAVVYVAVTVVWPSVTSDPVVRTVRYPDKATCEAHKAQALETAMAIEEAYDYARRG